MRYRSVGWGILGLGIVTIIVIISLHYSIADHSQILWRIVNQRCAASVQHKPCSVYKPENGYALLKDHVGKGQYLLIPTKHIQGIEEDLLLREGSYLYFYYAWQERGWISYAYGMSIPDTLVSLAINSRRARSQEQLHIHIDCMRPDVFYALRYYENDLRKKEIVIGGHSYQLRVLSHLNSELVTLFNKSIFIHENKEKRSLHGIFIAKMSSGNFIILDDKANGLHLGSTENLQDHTCRLMSTLSAAK